MISGIRKNKRAQMKIQEMAFVLIAIIIFFALVAVIFFSISLSSLKQQAGLQRQEVAMELVRKIADIPELSWAGCSGCVDYDKLMALKDKAVYDKFWDVDYLMVERIYPNRTQAECTKANYPDCATITIVNNTKFFGTTVVSFVSICSYEQSNGGYIRCELGRIHAAGKVIG